MATFSVRLCAQEVVPTEGTASWLEKHGTLPDVIEIVMEAPLSVWERVAVISHNGQVHMRPRNRNIYKDGPFDQWVKERLRRQIRETGKVSDLDAAAVEELISEYMRMNEGYLAEATAQEMKAARSILDGTHVRLPYGGMLLDDDTKRQIEEYRQKRDEERRQAEEEKKRAEEEEKRVYLLEREDWIRSHGSARLQMMLDEGFGLAATYREERLAFEYPGWVMFSSICGRAVPIRDPSAEALAALVKERANRNDKDITLVWLADGMHIEVCPHRDIDFIERPMLMTESMFGTIVKEIDRVQ